jgi:competence protein CoiA
MQLYALEENTPILAIHASRHQNYCCPECGATVRLRGGKLRQFHFFHLRSQPFCKQHQKSLTHLQIQLHLKSLIPGAFIEKQFPTIGRIADVAWEERKIIFEVQYSPISLEEVQKRNADYARCGYSVVWLLHDQQFNQRRLSSAETYLRQRPCYFVNGHKIYDQFEVIRDSKRIYRGPSFPIDITLPWTPKRDRFLEKRYSFSFRWKKWYQTLIVKFLERTSL